MTASELMAVLEALAPPAWAEPWDASGVQVASFSRDVTHLGVMLDPTPEGLRRAVEAGADFILAHHPLSMQPRFPDRADSYLASLALLLEHKVWLYSAHTPLDASPRGPARWLADALGLKDVAALAPRVDDAGAAYGLGFCGDLPRQVSYVEFCGLLGRALGKDAWQACGAAPAEVRRVACCPGSGSSLLDLAARVGADVFVTGDVKYHAALEAPVRVLDVGHFCLEEEMMRRLALVLAREVPVPVTFFPGADPLVPERGALRP